MAKVFDVDDRSDVLTKPVEQISSKVPVFPPSPPSTKLIHDIITGFCKDTSPARFEESGCTVCGQLTLLTDLKKIDGEKIDLNLLKCQGVTRLERFSLEDDMQEINKPVLDTGCNDICVVCLSNLQHGKVPRKSLANGLWLGNIPPQLAT